MTKKKPIEEWQDLYEAEVKANPEAYKAMVVADPRAWALTIIGDPEDEDLIRRMIRELKAEQRMLAKMRA